MDSETKTALLDLCELCQETLISASETRLIALRIHEALVSAGVQGYLDAHQSMAQDSSELGKARHRVERLVGDILSRLRKVI